MEFGALDAWDAVVQALAEELSAMPQARRETLVATLIARGGYESADAGPQRADRVQEARRALLHRLAERLSQGPARSLTANAA